MYQMKTNPISAKRIHWIAYERYGPGSSDGDSSALALRGLGCSDTSSP
jgi:hypothetical protein